MEKYINQYNRECWQGITNDTPFNSYMFHIVSGGIPEDELWELYTNIGIITVLDRLTGFGWRDIETGFRANDGEFWLASGNFDIRDQSPKTFGDAIELIKKNANICIGVKNSIKPKKVRFWEDVGDSIWMIDNTENEDEVEKFINFKKWLTDWVDYVG